MKIFLKVVVFAFISFATWVVTSALLSAQQKPSKSRSREIQVQSAPRSFESIRALNNPAPAIQGKMGASGALAEAHIRSNLITIADGFATVKAHVSLFDKRPGMSYIWRLRVVDNQENPLTGRVYDQQIFSVEVNGEKEVDFEDVIAVPPGYHRVELVLYEKAPLNDLSFLDDDKVAKGYESIRIVKLLNR
jgi:hypothetical protein